MRFLSALLAIAVVVLLPRGSEASPLIFTDRATFLNVHTALGLPPLAFETFDSNVWDINIGADVCTRDLNGLTISSDCHANGVLVGGVAVFDQNVFTTFARFDEPQTSLGFDYRVSAPCSSPFPFPCTATGVVQFGFSNGLTFFLSGSGFLGILDPSQPISIMATNHVPPNIADGVLVMDNLLLTRVPEPATALLVLAGAIVLSQLRRFMRAK